MAFTVNSDHARQVQVWNVVNSCWNKEPFQIRRMLTETSVRVSDRRAIFVGVDAYEAAGGTMLHDLFQSDDSGWLEDPAPLDQLVAEKLQAEAETIATEGWKWIEVALDLPYGYSHALRRLSGGPAPTTHADSAGWVADELHVEFADAMRQGAYAAVSGWQLSATYVGVPSSPPVECRSASTSQNIKTVAR